MGNQSRLGTPWQAPVLDVSTPMNLVDNALDGFQDANSSYSLWRWRHNNSNRLGDRTELDPEQSGRAHRVEVCQSFRQNLMEKHQRAVGRFGASGLHPLRREGADEGPFLKCLIREVLKPSSIQCSVQRMTDVSTGRNQY